jgi:hypothetical protein
VNRLSVVIALVSVALAVAIASTGFFAVEAAPGATGQPTTAFLHQQQLPAAPPKPTVAATRVEDRVRISYSFSVWPRAADRRPVMLLTAVKASEPRYSPYMKRHRISTRKGIVWQPLGLGSAPFKLYAAAYSRTGRSSPTVSTRVRNG